MALNLDQIRNYRQGGSLAIADAGGEGPAQIEKTGFVHWIKLRFGNVRAIEKNRTTLDTLRAAIQNDPRYFDDEVQNRAVQLLANISTSRTIGAAKIKGIIAELDRMSTPVEQRKSVMRLATGHLLALGLPEGAAGMEKAYKDAAVKFTLKLQPGETYANLQVVDRLNEFNAIMGRMFDRLGDNPDAKKLFASYVAKDRLFSGNGAMKSEEAIAALVDGIKETVGELDQIGRKHGETVRANILAGLNELGSPIPVDVLRSHLDGAANLPKCGLDQLNANSSAAEIHDAIAKFVRSIETKLNAVRFDSDDPYTIVWLQKIIGMGAVVSLSNDAKKSLLDALKTERGANLLTFYGANAVGAGPFQTMLVNVETGLQTQLKVDVDGAPPNTLVEMPADYNPAILPANAISDIDPELAANGNQGQEP